jgi:hypothetical protein
MKKRVLETNSMLWASERLQVGGRFIIFICNYRPGCRYLSEADLPCTYSSQIGLADIARPRIFT